MSRRPAGARVRRSLVLATGLCAAGVAYAQVAAVTGAGSRTCAQMQTDIADLPNVRRAYVSWMQGFLSGRNAAREDEALGLVDLADYEAQWSWVTAWCAERPDRTFADAVDALFRDRLMEIAQD